MDSKGGLLRAEGSRRSIAQTTGRPSLQRVCRLRRSWRSRLGRGPRKTCRRFADIDHTVAPWNEPPCGPTCRTSITKSPRKGVAGEAGVANESPTRRHGPGPDRQGGQRLKPHVPEGWRVIRKGLPCRSPINLIPGRRPRCVSSGHPLDHGQTAVDVCWALPDRDKNRLRVFDGVSVAERYPEVPFPAVTGAVWAFACVLATRSGWRTGAVPSSRRAPSSRGPAAGAREHPGPRR